MKPMLLTEVETKEWNKYIGWFAQIKENGIRGIVHIKGGKITAIRNRYDTPILYLFPEFENLKVADDYTTAIIDCEIVVEKNVGGYTKSVFYGGIDKRRSRDLKRALEYPAKLKVFDVIYWNSPLINAPYKERYNALQGIIQSKKVEVVPNWEIATENDLEGLWQKIEKEDREGLVLKNPMAIYEVGGRSKNYLKIKNYKQVDVVVERTETNEKGTKIVGTAVIGGNKIEVECQVGGKDVPIGSVQKVTYLDIYNNRLIQPHTKGE